MTKLITVTGRAGAGKTTIAAILAEMLSRSYSVCLIDNNIDNINIYDAAASIENINLYSCLPDKDSCSRAIKDSATEIKKSLYFFSGSYELLSEEKIQLLKKQNIFEYIILDSEYEIDNSLPDFIITVVNQNEYEYKTATEKMNMVTSVRFIDENFESMIIINRYTDSEFKVNQKDFKLFYCPEIINFANGYELSLSEVNEKEVERIIERITGDKAVVKAKKKFKLF